MSLKKDNETMTRLYVESAMGSGMPSLDALIAGDAVVEDEEHSKHGSIPVSRSPQPSPEILRLRDVPDPDAAGNLIDDRQLKKLMQEIEEDGNYNGVYGPGAGTKDFTRYLSSINAATTWDEVEDVCSGLLSDYGDKDGGEVYPWWEDTADELLDSIKYYAKVNRRL